MDSIIPEKLMIYERDNNSVAIKSTVIVDSFLSEIMDDEKEFKGNSVTDVYAKLSKKWSNQRESNISKLIKTR